LGFRLLPPQGARLDDAFGGHFSAPHPARLRRATLSPEGRGETGRASCAPSPRWGEGRGEGPCAVFSPRAHPHHFMLGKLNSAPALIPAGQRVVTVFSRV